MKSCDEVFSLSDTNQASLISQQSHPETMEASSSTPPTLVTPDHTQSGSCMSTETPVEDEERRKGQSGEGDAMMVVDKVHSRPADKPTPMEVEEKRAEEEEEEEEAMVDVGEEAAATK